MKRVALSEVKDDLSRYVRTAEKEQAVITRHGKLENDPRFLRRIESARRSLKAGLGVPLESVQ